MATLTDSPATVATDATGAEGTAPVVSWSDFYNRFRREWCQGEHISLVGPTGCGKTTLGIHLIALRPAVVAYAVKPRDETMDRLLRSGYLLEREWQPDLSRHIVLWPRFRGLGETDHMREVFSKSMNGAMRSNGWCIFMDEVAFFTAELGLERQLRVMWQVARSTGVTIVAATQRPAHVPLVMYDQAVHLFFWRDNDERNLQRLGGLGGMSKRQIIREVSTLDKHQVLYINTDTGERLRTKVEVR